MNMMIRRDELLRRIQAAFERSRVVTILGPRQCGKTTLAREFASPLQATYFDLEDPKDAAGLANPMLALGSLTGLAVIDEAQRNPGLFPVLRVLADRVPLPAKFLLLGSASPNLVRGISESLAGRIAFVDMSGFTLSEAGEQNWRTLWIRGGFPLSYLAESDADSLAWRRDFLRTFLERDFALLGLGATPSSLGRLWLMLAHHHGQILNASELGRSLGESYKTVQRHLDLLSGSYMIRLLPPWFENLGKRLVRSPKVYVRDSGLFHALLELPAYSALQGHPKLGASWEGFALEQVLRITGDQNAYFWATQAGAELDLLLFWQGRRIGIEFKYADAPVMTKSLRIAHEDLKLDRAWVVYPGDRHYALETWADALPLPKLFKELR